MCESEPQRAVDEFNRKGLYKNYLTFLKARVVESDSGTGLGYTTEVLVFYLSILMRMWLQLLSLPFNDLKKIHLFIISASYVQLFAGL